MKPSFVTVVLLPAASNDAAKSTASVGTAVESISVQPTILRVPIDFQIPPTLRQVAKDTMRRFALLHRRCSHTMECCRAGGASEEADTDRRRSRSPSATAAANVISISNDNTSRLSRDGTDSSTTHNKAAAYVRCRSSLCRWLSLRDQSGKLPRLAVTGMYVGQPCATLSKCAEIFSHDIVTDVVNVQGEYVYVCIRDEPPSSVSHHSRSQPDRRRWTSSATVASKVHSSDISSGSSSVATHRDNMTSPSMGAHVASVDAAAHGTAEEEQQPQHEVSLLSAEPWIGAGEGSQSSASTRGVSEMTTSSMLLALPNTLACTPITSWRPNARESSAVPARLQTMTRQYANVCRRVHNSDKEHADPREENGEVYSDNDRESESEDEGKLVSLSVGQGGALGVVDYRDLGRIGSEEMSATSAPRAVGADKCDPTSVVMVMTSMMDGAETSRERPVQYTPVVSHSSQGSETSKGSALSSMNKECAVGAVAAGEEVGCGHASTVGTVSETAEERTPITQLAAVHTMLTPPPFTLAHPVAPLYRSGETDGHAGGTDAQTNTKHDTRDESHDVGEVCQHGCTDEEDAWRSAHHAEPEMSRKASMAKVHTLRITSPMHTPCTKRARLDSRSLHSQHTQPEHGLRVAFRSAKVALSTPDRLGWGQKSECYFEA